MATHKEEAAKMGERGKQLAKSLYNDEQCAKEVIECLKRVLKEK